MAKGTGYGAHLIPPLDIPNNDSIEKIYSGEPESVLVGLRVAHTVIFGPGFLINDVLQSPNHSVIQALSRFISDRAN